MEQYIRDWLEKKKLKFLEDGQVILVWHEEYDALLRVARAAERLLEQGNQWYGFSGMPGIDKEYKAIVEALEALPKGILDG